MHGLSVKKYFLKAGHKYTYRIFMLEHHCYYAGA